jgi:phage gpG-like protein
VERLLWEWDARDVEEWFEYAGFRARNPRTPLRQAGDVVIAAVRRAFANEADPATATPWRQLSRGYAREKVRIWGFEEPILQASDPSLGGGLKTQAERRSNIDILVNTGGGSVEYNLDHPYAELHQTGTPPAQGDKGDGMPARRFLGLSPEDRDQIDFVFWAWLEDIKRVNRRARARGGDNPFEGFGYRLV